MFRKGKRTATDLGNLIGGLFVAGFVVSVPLAIAYTHSSNKGIQADKTPLEVNVPDKPLRPVDKPNRTDIGASLPFEVRYLEPIFYTGLVASFGLGFVAKGISTDRGRSKR